jgi:hypothetical protein
MTEHRDKQTTCKAKWRSEMDALSLLSLTAIGVARAPWPTQSVFPTGWYSSEGFHLDRISTLPPPPFGLVLNYNGGENTTAELRDYMLAMATRNASVVMEVPRRWLMPTLALDNISAMAKALSPHANLAGWYLADEPDKQRSAIPIATLVAARKALLAAVAPKREPPPIFAALCTNLTLANATLWAAAVDIRIYDFYPCRKGYSPFHESAWQRLPSLLVSMSASAAAFAGGVWPAWQGSSVDGPQRGWRQCSPHEEWLMLVAAAAHRAQGLLYYRLATNAGVVNSSLIQEAIVPAISALADELGALTTPGADLPIECAPPAGGLAFSARLVARPQGGWLALLVMWGDGDTGGNRQAVALRCKLPPSVNASTARALDAPGRPIRALANNSDRTLQDVMVPFTASAIWLEAA